MNKYLNYVIQWTWGLLMNIIGLIGFLATLPFSKRSTFNGCPVIAIGNGWGAVTLGMFIFTSTTDETTLAHEYGHIIQNAILGVFFPFVIGLPSLIHAWLHHKVCKETNYYHFYTEKWADKLGGVFR